MRIEERIQQLSTCDPIFDFFDDGSIIVFYLDESGRLRHECILEPENARRADASLTLDCCTACEK